MELPGLDDVLGLTAAVQAARAAGELPGVGDVVPAARTVLLVATPGTEPATLRDPVAALARTASGQDRTVRAPLVVPVAYDGPDLDDVAAHTGMGRAGVIAAHTGTPWRVAFGGFAPGFAYLTGGDPQLDVPRRAEPRTAVPAGAVGLAGTFSGIYPRSSPGGWQLIGRTAAPLWDPDREPPALLSAGDEVRFRAVDDLGEDGVGSRDGAPDEAATGRAARNGAAPTRIGAAGAAGAAHRRVVEVIATGPLALVQDRGRPGLAGSGVGPGGAADRAALALANRLLANPPDAAGVEVLGGGLVLAAGPRLAAPLLVVVTGAPAPCDVDGTDVAGNALIVLRAGQRLRLGAPPSGLRSYVGVRGGIAVAPVLGSRSRDVLAGLGPAPLTVGDRLPVGPEPATLPLVDLAPLGPPPAGPVTLTVVLGPRADWLVDPGSLTATSWTVSPRSDRVGLRLLGPALSRALRGELPSEGVVRGSVQVPPGGEPVLFLADHPVTGGYPVVAVVVDADIDRAAQLRPGQAVRFRTGGGGGRGRR